MPSGQTVNLPTVGTFDYAEVGGTLRASRSANISVKFTTLVILPGGTLDVGSPADPIPAGIPVELIVQNVPIDVTKDPFQWGNGIASFGTFTVNSRYRTPAAALAADVQAGSCISRSPLSGWEWGRTRLPRYPAGDLSGDAEGGTADVDHRREFD